TPFALISWSGRSAMQGAEADQSHSNVSEGGIMKFGKWSFIAAAAALIAAASAAFAQDKVIKFGMAQDFTAVYTFVTAEYSQGQRDYFSLINEGGGINGHKIVAEVVDHGNAPQRGIEAYERFK